MSPNRPRRLRNQSGEPAPANVVKKRRVPLWTLPVAAVIVAAVYAAAVSQNRAPSAGDPAPAPAPEPVEIAPKPIKAVEPLAMKLPLHQAEVVASKEKKRLRRSCHSPLRW